MGQQAKTNEQRSNLTNSENGDPQTVEDLTQKNIETIHRFEEAAIEHQTLSERISKRIADFCGSMTFVWVHIVWFSGWIILNFVPGLPHFDEFPFTFLTLIVSLEAIFLSTFILISQNQETRLTERNNQLDLQINLLTEQENTKMLQILKQIAQKLEIEIAGDPTIELLEQSTRPDKLIQQIIATKESFSERANVPEEINK